MTNQNYDEIARGIMTERQSELSNERFRNHLTLKSRIKSASLNDSENDEHNYHLKAEVDVDGTPLRIEGDICRYCFTNYEFAHPIFGGETGYVTVTFGDKTSRYYQGPKPSFDEDISLSIKDIKVIDSIIGTSIRDYVFKEGRDFQERELKEEMKSWKRLE